ncbi:MGMT family protein [Parasulfuritortus cantonensis]|uniref:MGMT family protein n=1 Tax=Parasulfuritortus cantonensis TaxID=2528202 RepID=A0A4R1BGI0_9PROT|nr:MGMT family protein [Parasulfuritortus cantonensis]TCJ16254.1 MGMT family protein [Parasulfuritortus cantonensis]
MSGPDYDAVLPAPFGALGVRLLGEALSGLDFLPPETPLRPSGSAVVHRVAHELEAYYADPGHVWKLVLAPAGTLFRQRVWQSLLAIPPGRTRTYGELAEELASSPRAVGQAVGDNPIPIVIPCHRVLAAHGLGGFMHGTAGFPMAVKQWLLHHEGADAGS